MYDAWPDVHRGGMSTSLCAGNYLCICSSSHTVALMSGVGKSTLRTVLYTVQSCSVVQNCCTVLYSMYIQYTVQLMSLIFWGVLIHFTTPWWPAKSVVAASPQPPSNICPSTRTTDGVDVDVNINININSGATLQKDAGPRGEAARRWTDTVRAALYCTIQHSGGGATLAATFRACGSGSTSA